VRAFQGGNDIEEYLWHARRILGALGRLIARQLQQAGLRVVSPSGAFYLFLDFKPLAATLRDRHITTSRILCDRLLEETGVAVLPGCVFGRAMNELTARLSYVDFGGASALVAARQSPKRELGKRFLQQYCSRVLQAVDRICEWAHAR
jgi:aspartate aminotransferase